MVCTVFRLAEFDLCHQKRDKKPAVINSNGTRGEELFVGRDGPSVHKESPRGVYSPTWVIEKHPTVLVNVTMLRKNEAKNLETRLVACETFKVMQ